VAVQIAVVGTAFVARKAITACGVVEPVAAAPRGSVAFAIEFAELVKKSVHVAHEAGWDRVGLDETLGGIPTPKALI
jgi:hypothetical protein